jgi:5-formyltetrahydrofolate cyclo-ligase
LGSVRARAINQQPPLVNLKTRLRAEAATLRRQVSQRGGVCAAQALSSRGFPLIRALPNAQIIGGYYPIRDELNPLRLLQALCDDGRQIGLPAICPGPGLTFRAWTPGTPLKRSQLGLSEPEAGYPEVVPGIVLVPLLAFDSHGNRLGYGAGYYDAALRDLRRRAPVIAIGLGFDEQQFREIPREPQDEPLDMILTPTRTLTCGE